MTQRQRKHAFIVNPGIVPPYPLQKKGASFCFTVTLIFSCSPSPKAYLDGTVGKAALREHLVTLHEQHHLVAGHQSLDCAAVLPAEHDDKTPWRLGWGHVRQVYLPMHLRYKDNINKGWEGGGGV